MNKFLLLIITTSSIYGCGGGTSDSTNSTDSIVGDWSTELERNGAIGESHWVISENSIDTYEIGNGQIMDEWHSGLDINKTYKFTVDGNDGTYVLNEGKIEYKNSPEQSNTARISELPSGNEIYSWEIGNDSSGEVFVLEYKLVNGSLEITLPDQSKQIYTLTEK